MQYRIEIWYGHKWNEYSIETELLFAKSEFEALTSDGYTVRVQECRDLNRGKEWLG